MQDLEALLILNHFFRLNGKKARLLIEAKGSPQKAAEACTNDSAMASWEKDLELIEKEKVNLISFFDTNYPAVFRDLPDPPLLLYVKGKLPLLDQKGIAIIGTRECTHYGREKAEQFAEDLAKYGFIIVSGLARGIDTAAHIGALKTGKTIAILGSGLSHLYPRENSELASKIASSGPIISEFPMHWPAEKHFFPKRNRLVSALSKAVLLIEAPIKSGAMITIQLALSQNKICFAMPGRIDYDTFSGNHLLIKTQKAHLVENSSDMLSLLLPEQENFDIAHNQGIKSVKSIFLDPEEEILYAVLTSEEISIEELLLRVDLPILKVNSLLMRLVLKGVVREYPGKFYKKVN